jgi:hypothetical protein
LTADEIKLGGAPRRHRSIHAKLLWKRLYSFGRRPSIRCSSDCGGKKADHRGDVPREPASCECGVVSMQWWVDCADAQLVHSGDAVTQRMRDSDG